MLYFDKKSRDFLSISTTNCLLGVIGRVLFRFSSTLYRINRYNVLEIARLGGRARTRDCGGGGGNDGGNDFGFLSLKFI
jgi:hypothetical protein